MTETLSPIGFWSYARQDDEEKLSGLRSILQRQLQQKYGREPIKIFQDVAAIPPGADWNNKITEALHSSTFLIPIITPNFLESEWCNQEFFLFLEREQAIAAQFPELAASKRIFPIFYIDITDVEAFNDQLLPKLRERQWTNFRDLIYKEDTHESVRLRLDQIAESIVKVLRQDQRAIKERRIATQAAEASALQAASQKQAQEETAAAQKAAAEKWAQEAEALRQKQEAERIAAEMERRNREQAEQKTQAEIPPAAAVQVVPPAHKEPAGWVPDQPFPQQASTLFSFIAVEDHLPGTEARRISARSITKHALVIVAAIATLALSCRLFEFPHFLGDLGLSGIGYGCANVALELIPVIVIGLFWSAVDGCVAVALYILLCHLGLVYEFYAVDRFFYYMFEDAFWYSIFLVPIGTLAVSWTSRQMSKKMNRFLSSLIASAVAAVALLWPVLQAWRPDRALLGTAIAVPGAALLYTALTYQGPRFQPATAISTSVLRWLGGVELPDNQPGHE